VVSLTFEVGVPHLERHLDASFKCASDGVLIIQKASPSSSVYAYLLTTCQPHEDDRLATFDGRMFGKTVLAGAVM